VIISFLLHLHRDLRFIISYFYLLWLCLVVKVGFCVLRLTFEVCRLPQRGIEHEAINPACPACYTAP